MPGVNKFKMILTPGYSYGRRCIARMVWVSALAAAVLLPPEALALEAGAAKLDVTPTYPVPLDGKWERWGSESTEVHDPIWARALYLDDGETQVVLVTVDLWRISPELRSRVLELAPIEVPREHVILVATHTHNGPGGMFPGLPHRFLSGAFLPGLVEQTARGIVDTMRAAYESKRRAAIGYGTGKQDVLSGNRSKTDGPVEQQIGVLRVDDADGNIIAVLANFAAQPDIAFSASKLALSAGYPGAYYKELEGLASEGCIAFFLYGAGGDQRAGNPESVSGWAQVESIGRLLAIRAKGIANEIECGEAALRFAFSAPELPMSIATAFMPTTTILQTLEIGGVAVTFVPGDPVAAVGRLLRDQATALGYDAHFTVGAANSFLSYVTTAAEFASDSPESRFSFYGPQFARWLEEESAVLLERGSPSEPAAALEPAPVRPLDGGLYLLLRGDAHSLGVQRGLRFQEDLQVRYQERVQGADLPETLLLKEGPWAYWPSLFDSNTLGLPRLAAESRRMLAGFPPDAVQEIAGLAQGAKMPFDAVWLLQHAGYLGSQESPRDLSTGIAVRGDRAGADGLIVGCTLDWAEAETPVIAEVRPSAGHAFVHIGFTWTTGTFAGMNDAGLVLALLRRAARNPVDWNAPPVEAILRGLLQSQDSYDGALRALRGSSLPKGTVLLVAGIGEADGQAAVFEPGAEAELRPAGDTGLLLGARLDPEGPQDSASSRYRRAETLLAGERIIGPPELGRLLLDTEAASTEGAPLWNEHTRHAVIFLPKSRSVAIAFPSMQGGPGAYTELVLKQGVSNE